MDLLLLRNLKTELIPSLVSIQDAAYENDPEGTNADSAYFVGHVHNYLKHIGISLQPDNVKFVSNNFTLGGIDKLGDPFFETITEAYSQVTNNSSEANKALIVINHRGASYSENLTFNDDGSYVIIQGTSKYGTVLSGTIVISQGTHIFRNIKFTGSIQVTGGKVVFEDCIQTEAETSITGTATVMITKCDCWGNITISPDLTNVKLWCEDILNVYAPAAGEASIEIPAALTTPEIVLRRVTAQGGVSDTGSHISETTGLEINAMIRPII